ncbi:MAG: DUF3943 domain-containing protein [Bacteroidetes bacterium]|nr:DUF3943 domain-containing protein [Bacteroidota bacterium]
MDDSLRHNQYGNLRDDNPLYNKKSSVAMVALRVTLANVSTWAVDRFIFNYDFARVGPDTWQRNIESAPVWDSDRFGMNYFFHPFSGGMFFNAARANGFDFYESIPFAFLGSLEWEYLGENTHPSYNDFINTPVNGVFFGEILYRLGSNILDDGATGWSRFFRETAVAIMTPTRFFSRLFSGALARTTTDLVYQKEPLNITLSGGYHRVNEGKTWEFGTNSVNVNLHLDYGNPFEKRTRKPYDFFKLRTDLDFGVGRKIIDNITGYGVLVGRNVATANSDLFVGIFQHMNFFDNNTFELGTIGFGPGVMSKLPTSKKSNLYANLHVALVPFGGLSGRWGPDTTQTRDYNYSGGAELKVEASYDFGGICDLTLIGYYWALRTYVGTPESSYIALVKPRLTFHLFDNVSIGFEHLIYYSDRYPTNFPSVHSVRTEQKVFVSIFLEEFKFKRNSAAN